MDCNRAFLNLNVWNSAFGSWWTLEGNNDSSLLPLENYLIQFQKSSKKFWKNLPNIFFLGFSNLLSNLVTGTFIIEKQPPQVKYLSYNVNSKKNTKPKRDFQLLECNSLRPFYLPPPNIVLDLFRLLA